MPEYHLIYMEMCVKGNLRSIPIGIAMFKKDTTYLKHELKNQNQAKGLGRGPSAKSRAPNQTFWECPNLLNLI